MGARRSGGFSLIELLIVVAIIGVMAVVSIQSFSSVGRNQAVGKATGDLVSILEMARSHAMANNSYVYVGFYKPSGADLAKRGSGSCVYVSVAATVDGTSGYENGSWTPSLVSLSKLQCLEGVSLVPVDSIKTYLPNVDMTFSSLDAATTTALTTFTAQDLGFGQGRNPVGTFDLVIQFKPNGGANVVTDLTGQTVPHYVAVGLVPATGSSATVSANCSLIRVDGVTGFVRFYRPGQM
ncbi:prepilin-type N-terminal cleavage/methylation domain-containing protein [Verrucomicrobium sp. GAS474]|nr:prepilin-type N-terminal cleavage/methylation domain-containing protein [Verrucomicrobium sp. GAS474]SDU27641.1 prepilin-type N-terminal cleavage/methylation domain-containing protein [Verrucomicrobium sp. GAS474]